MFPSCYFFSSVLCYLCACHFALTFFPHFRCLPFMLCCNFSFPLFYACLSCFLVCRISFFLRFFFMLSLICRCLRVSFILFFPSFGVIFFNGHSFLPLLPFCLLWIFFFWGGVPLSCCFLERLNLCHRCLPFCFVTFVGVFFFILFNLLLFSTIVLIFVMIPVLSVSFSSSLFQPYSYSHVGSISCFSVFVWPPPWLLLMFHLLLSSF